MVKVYKIHYILLQQSCPPLITTSYRIPIRRAALPFSSFQRLILCVLKHSPHLPYFYLAAIFSHFCCSAFFLNQIDFVLFTLLTVAICNCFFHSKRHYFFSSPKSVTFLCTSFLGNLFYCSSLFSFFVVVLEEGKYKENLPAFLSHFSHGLCSPAVYLK